MIKGAAIGLVAFCLGSWVGYLATMKYVEIQLESFAAKAKTQLPVTHKK